MAQPESVKIVDQCQIAPAFKYSPELAVESSHPLTFFDIHWLRLPPVERLYFYQLPDSSSSPTAFFNSEILPKLKESLSCTLLRFLPLAGQLVWPADSYKPIILCKPNDTVSLTIAESSANFDRLSGNQVHEAVESRPYAPELPSTETMASAISLQITLFPGKGFCIGIAAHHAILDGKSSTMFVKAWAYMCKQVEKEPQPPMLPDELTPFCNREVVKDVAGLETVYLNDWSAMSKADPDANPRSLKVWQSFKTAQNLVRSTFQLTREDIKVLREKVMSEFSKVEDINTISQLHLSTFVLILAYLLVCWVKAKKLGDGNRRVFCVFVVDARSRLNPPIPENYLGNCLCSQYFLSEARDISEENGLIRTVKTISSIIKGLDQGGLFERARDVLKQLGPLEPGTVFSAAGSTRFEVYGTDFGWGRPEKVEITSIDRTGAVSLAESRDGNGGIEIGLVLKSREMEDFTSSFISGLKVL